MKDWCSLISIICEKYDKSLSFIIIIYYLGSLIKLDEFKWDDHLIQEIILQGIPTVLDRYFFKYNTGSVKSLDDFILTPLSKLWMYLWI